MSGERTLPWTHQSRALAGYRLRYGDHPVGDGEYVYRYDGTETVQTSVPSARWHPGDTFRVLDRIDHPEWTRVDEDGNAIDNGIASVATLPDVQPAFLGEDAGAHDLSTPAPPVAVPAALAPAKAPVKPAVKTPVKASVAIAVPAALAPVKAPIVAVAVPVEVPAKEPATAPAEAPAEARVKTASRP